MGTSIRDGGIQDQSFCGCGRAGAPVRGWRVMLAADFHSEDLGLGVGGAFPLSVPVGFEIPMRIADVMRREGRKGESGCMMVAFRRGNDSYWKWGVSFCVWWKV